MQKLEIVMQELLSMGEEKRKAIQIKQGLTNSYGIPLGKLRTYAKNYKGEQELGMKLWMSGNYEAMMLATMIMDPKQLTSIEMEQMIDIANHNFVVDEVAIKLFAVTKEAEQVMKKWIFEKDLKGRAGWNIAIGILMKKKLKDETINELLDIIYKDMKDTEEEKRWAMNRFLCETGIRREDYRDTCLSIGEELGVYKDQKVPKGCTSAYALSWIPAGIRLAESKKKK